MDNKQHVESIRDELVKVYNGEIIATEEDCNCYDGIEPGDVISLWDYFMNGDGIYNIDYIVASDKKTLLGVRLMVACGGPNIYINTFENAVQLYWWSDTATAWLPSEISDEITDIFQELWDC